MKDSMRKPADLQGIRNGLQSRDRLCPFIMAKILVTSACRDNQGIVGQAAIMHSHRHEVMQYEM
jgi:hypothetical protein